MQFQLSLIPKVVFESVGVFVTNMPLKIHTLESVGGIIAQQIQSCVDAWHENKSSIQLGLKTKYLELTFRRSQAATRRFYL